MKHLNLKPEQFRVVHLNLNLQRDNSPKIHIKSFLLHTERERERERERGERERERERERDVV